MDRGIHLGTNYLSVENGYSGSYSEDRTYDIWFPTVVTSTHRVFNVRYKVFNIQDDNHRPGNDHCSTEGYQTEVGGNEEVLVVEPDYNDRSDVLSLDLASGSYRTSQFRRRWGLFRIVPITLNPIVPR